MRRGAVGTNEPEAASHNFNIDKILEEKRGAGSMNARVLIVDDIECIRRVIRRIVEREGCEVVGEAKDGAEAIEQFHKLNPDLITMDVTMPRCSGIDALRQIVKADPDARVVMCSAMGEEKLVTEALEAGARDFIVKPFRCQHVITALRKAL